MRVAGCLLFVPMLCILHAYLRFLNVGVVIAVDTQRLNALGWVCL